MTYVAGLIEQEVAGVSCRKVGNREDGTTGKVHS